MKSKYPFIRTDGGLCLALITLHFEGKGIGIGNAEQNIIKNNPITN
jgi:hypothetical protein